jgi:hypothetical protein
MYICDFASLYLVIQCSITFPYSLSVRCILGVHIFSLRTRYPLAYQSSSLSCFSLSLVSVPQSMSVPDSVSLSVSLVVPQSVGFCVSTCVYTADGIASYPSESPGRRRKRKSLHIVYVRFASREPSASRFELLLEHKGSILNMTRRSCREY